MLTVLAGCGTDLVAYDGVDGKAAKALRSQTDYKELPRDFINMWPGECELENLIGGNVVIGDAYGVLYNEQLYIGVGVIYHYRNDSTRKLWGNSKTIEENLPSEKQQVQRLLVHASYAVNNKPDDVVMNIEMHCYDQGDGTSTDDRHQLFFFFPFPKYQKENLVQLVKKIINPFGLGSSEVSAP